MIKKNYTRIFILLSLLCATLQACKDSVQTASTKPTLHYRPANGVKSGDAIPYYWNGEYHVFFMKEGDWAHIVSSDLVRWRELPNAVRIGDSTQEPDGEGIWTGSIVEHNGEFYLFYTDKNSEDPLGDQKVMLARSKDLITWTKHPEFTFYADGKTYWSKPINGSIDDKQQYHHQAFRDPHVVWNEQKGEWWMILHAILPDGSFPVVGFYTSSDLMNWSVQPPFVTYPAAVSGDCPEQFWENGMWNIICADYHYMQISEPGAVNPEVKPYDCGDMRVPKSMYDGKRRVIIGWLGEYDDLCDAGSFGWGGSHTMAREIYLDSSNQLCQRPVKEVIALYDKELMKKRDVAVGSRFEAPLNYMTKATIDPCGKSPKATIHFRQLADSSYRFNIDFSNGEIEIASAYKSYKRVCDFDKSKPVNVQLFVDGTVAECFVNDAYCFTMLIYDLQGNEISFETDDANCKITNFEVWQSSSL